MPAPRSHPKHERNLERNLDVEPPASAARAAGVRFEREHPRAADVAAKLARDAAQREAARRAAGRAPEGGSAA